MTNSSHTNMHSESIRDRSFYLLLCLLILVAAFPVIFNSHIPLADLPNHLARVHVWTASGTENAVPFISPVLALQPNLAFDLIVGALTSVVPIEQAGRIFILLTILSMVLGPAILGKKLNGYFTIWSFAPLLFIYNRLFYWGFLGYLFSIGIALAVSAVWLEDHPKTRYLNWALKGACGAFVVLICHLFAYGFLGLVVAGISLRKIISESTGFFVEDTYCFLKKIAPVVVPLPILVFASPAFETNYSIAWGPFVGKLSSIAGTLIGSDFWVAPILAITLLLCVLFLVWEEHLLLPKWGLVLVGSLVVIHLCMPDKLISSYGADKRLPIAIALLCCALASTGKPLKIKRKSIILSLLFSIIVVKSLSTNEEWSDYQGIHSAHMAAFDTLKPKSSVIHLVGTTKPYGLPNIPLTEEASYAVILKSVFWPGIFAYPIHGAQSIEFTPREAGYPGSSSLQKIPLTVLAQVVSGQQTYGEFDKKTLLQCFDYMMVSTENGSNERLPKVSFFGPTIFSNKYISVYENDLPRNCEWATDK